MSSAGPLLSVIVPAYNGAAILPRTLEALAASDLPRHRWELIVVDDASVDATAEVAGRWADRVISLAGRPHGPGFARNRGVEASRGAWVVFIDADVVVHRDTLRSFVETIEREPRLDAVFGAYDDSPPAPGFLSQYRNLLHRYVHLTGRGESESFWAGCGAVRRTGFVEAGGFDQRRYPRPMIEDIELGYRLRERGGRILLNPEIQGAHLKRWTFRGSVKTDLLDRGIPWTRLLLERQRLAGPANLNLSRAERIKAVGVCLGFVLLAVGVAVWRPEPVVAAGGLLVAVLLSNLALFRWFYARRGLPFVLGVVPMTLWYYVISSLSVGVGVISHLLARSSGTAPGVFSPGISPSYDDEQLR